MVKLTQVQHNSEITVAAEALRVVTAAAAEAVKTISDAAIAATKVLSDNAANTAKAIDIKNAGDHDLIIEIKTIQQTMLTEIREIKDGTAKRISDLERDKLNYKDSYPVLYKDGVEKSIEDLELRTRKNEINITKLLTWGTFAIILLNAIAYIITNIWNK